MARRLALAALLWCALAPAAQPGEDMRWPGPVAWGEPIDRPRLAGALAEALANSKWLIEADNGKSITARHEARSQLLRIRIDYEPQRIRYHYVDSRNFSYAEENEHRYIHRRANRLMARLDREVRVQVQRRRLEDPPMRVVPVLPADEAGLAAPEPALDDS